MSEHQATTREPSGYSRISMEQRIVGIWQQIPSPMLSRYLGAMGWPCVILDRQHCAFNDETAYECCQVLRDQGVRPMIRVVRDTPHQVEQALDWGAGGVVVPMVNSPGIAVKVARAAKYPPAGCRSLGDESASVATLESLGRLNTTTCLLVQMEHFESTGFIRDIMAVEGVDGCFVGPKDLALSMRLDLESYERDAAYQQAILSALHACRTNGKLVACNTYSLDDARDKFERGFQLITMGSDRDLIFEAGQHRMRQLMTISETLPQILE